MRKPSSCKPIPAPHAAAVLRKLQKSAGPLVITQRGRAIAVIQSVDAYEKSEQDRELLRILAPGEASCIAQAKARGGVVITDDRAARQCCHERGVVFTGTIGILTISLRPSAAAALKFSLISSHETPVASLCFSSGLLSS